MRFAQFLLRHLGDIIVLLISAVLVCTYYGDILFNPGDFMFNALGDGIKNYYTPAWFVEHNESWMYFDGMNHPNGDLFVYADGHPALSTFMRALGVSGPAMVGVINFLIIFSLFVAPFFIRRVMRLIGAPQVTAIAGAVAIAALAPQVERFAGHYSLSYVFAIPLTIWLFLRFINAERKWGWTLALAITSLFWFFTHPYLGLMGSMFLILAHIMWWMQKEGEMGWLSRAVHLVVQAFVPIGITNGVISILDTVVDRPAEPWGFWDFQASMESVFVPVNGPMAPWFGELLNFKQVEWEAKAYVGLVVTLGLIGILASIIRKRSFALRGFIISPWILLVPGALILLFSFGLPFNWYPEMTDWVPFVKNFRALARFAWVFYFCAGMVVFTWLGIWLENNRKNSNLLTAVVVLLAALSVWESTSTHNRISERITQSPNLFLEDNLDDFQQKLVENAQGEFEAILPLPFFYIGTDRFRRHGHKPHNGTAMLLSYHTGLPLIASQMSRSSMSQSKSHIGILAPTFYPQPFANELNDESPVLVLGSESHMQEEESAIWAKSQSIVQGMDDVLRSIRLSKYLTDVETPEISRPISFREKIISDSLLWNSGERMELMKVYNPVMEWQNLAAGNYELSMWWWNPENILDQANVIIAKKKGDDKEEWIGYGALVNSYCFSGDSARYVYDKNFEATDPAASYTVYIKIPKKNTGKVAVNHLMLREKSDTVTMTMDKGLSVNNHIALPISWSETE